MNDDELRRAIEALLFVTDKPLSAENLREVLETDAGRIQSSLDSIGKECEESRKGFRLKYLAGGYQFISAPSVAAIVRKFIQTRERRKLSQASLETLSIVAYRQPITRAEIEFIRGVNVDGAIHTLLEKGLVRIAGRKEAPGRPILYSTSKDFLNHFGLGSLKELPPLAEFTEGDIELPEHLRQEAQERTEERAADGTEAPQEKSRSN